MQQVAKARANVSGTAIQAYGFQQAAHIPGDAAVQIERVWISLTRKCELTFEPFEFDDENCSAPDDHLLGRGGVRLVGEVLADQILAPTDPRGTAVNAGQKCGSVRDPALLCLDRLSDLVVTAR
jgi:hypothetical protein